MADRQTGWKRGGRAGFRRLQHARIDMDRASLITPLTWSECKEAVRENNLSVLGRSVSQQNEYNLFVDAIKQRYCNVADYVLESKFGCAVRENEQTGKLEAVVSGVLTEKRTDRLLLALNDYPYHYEPGIVHYILWKVGSPITSDEILRGVAEVEDVLRCKENRCIDSCWYVNPAHLKSVLEIDHAHILLKIAQ